MNLEPRCQFSIQGFPSAQAWRMTYHHPASFPFLVFPSRVLCSSPFSPSPSIIVSQTSPASFRFPPLYQLAYSLLSSPHLDPSYLFLVHAIGFPFPLLQLTNSPQSLPPYLPPHHELSNTVLASTCSLGPRSAPTR